MKLPLKFKIENYSWKITRKWRIPFGMGDALGLTIPSEREIQIIHGLTNDELDYVVIHEVIHAILAEKGLYIAGLSPELEEIICHSVAKEFLNIFSIKFKTPRTK